MRLHRLHLIGVDSDSDSHEQVRLQKEARQLRRPRHTSPTDPVLAAAELEPLAPALLTRQTPNPVHSTSTTRRRALNSRVKPQYTVKRKIQAPATSRRKALELRSGSYRSSGNCRPKRKRWSNSISTTIWGSDNLDHQPAKRHHRQDTDRRKDTLWTHLNQ